MIPQPPKPFHPQQNFGSGAQPAALAYPHLAAYYGDDFTANFTTLDLLDSLAHRMQLMEEVLDRLHADAAAGEVAGMMSQGLQQMIDALSGGKPLKLPWYVRLLYRLQGRRK